MHNMIQQILDKKKEDLVEEKKQTPLSVILNGAQRSEGSQGLKPRDSSQVEDARQGARNDNLFRQVMLKPKHGGVALVAEIKFASPTNPNLGSPEDLLKRVKEYEKSGADAVSIITEKHFFKGSLDFVTQTKKAVKIPILQKDFVIDDYQIYQAKSIGSDAILLIARLVDEKTLRRFVDIALKIGIEPVVEINDAEDLEKAVATNTNIIAVNARDLDTFEVSINKACELLKKVPEKYIKLGFSGIKGKSEVDLYYNAGANAILVGTALMNTKNIYNFILSLRGRSLRPTRQSLDFKS